MSRHLLSRRGFLGSSAAALGVSGRRRPNVLVVIADEWRTQATSWNGDRNVWTPALDRFARESVSFDRAVSNLPVCCPARASMMTGQYPLTHRVFINDVELKPKGVTLGEAFRNAGYATGYIGKWHLHGSPDGNYGRRLAPIPREKRLGFDYWKACECTHDYNHSLYYSGDNPEPKYWSGYDAAAQTGDAIAFIQDAAKRANPFLLCLSLGPPHFPYETAPAEFRERYRDREIQLRPNVPEARRAQGVEELRGYYAHMAALDACFARLFGVLERTGIAEDTIVVFLSDHGDMMLSQGLTTKLYPWDESVRVPMLIRYPRALGRKGWRSSATFNMPDLMPTILSLAGLLIPDGVEGSVRLKRSGVQEDASASLILLPVPITEARRYGFLEYRGLRTPRYSYVRSIRAPWLLYDNQEDPYQMHNLVEAAGFRQLREQLNRQLDAELRNRNDEFLPAAEYLKQDGLTHYKEPNVPLGYAKSPWGDWESTNLEFRSPG
jgi:arylsulfatase A-like enzyme